MDGKVLNGRLGMASRDRCSLGVEFNINRLHQLMKMKPVPRVLYYLFGLIDSDE